MANARRITIEFLGNSKGLDTTANKVESKMSTLGDRMNKVGGIAGKALGGGLLVAGAAAVKAGQAAAADEAAQSKLAQTLEKATGASKGQVAATESWITAQGKALGVADDDLRPALSKLAVATGDVGKAQKLAALGMDISAGSGKSLEAVSAALAKAQNGNVGGLAKLGVSTKDAAGKTLSLDQITKNLADTYSGAASKAADTTAGKQKKLQVQFGELQEQIGAKLLPIFAKLADWGLKTIDWMDRNQTTVKVLAGAFAGIVGTLYLVSKAMTAVNIVMALNPIGAVVLAIAALAAGLVFAYKKSDTFRSVVDSAFKAVAKVATWLWNGIYQPAMKGIVTAIGWVITAMGKMLQAIGSIKGFGWAKEAGDKMVAAGEAARGMADAIKKIPSKKDVHISVYTREVMKGRNAAALQYSGGQVGHNARGTNNWRGGPTWLHEQGPEIVDLPNGSRVIPAPLSRRMAAGGGGDVNITINGALDPNAVARQVQQLLLRYKRTNGGGALGIA
ncbi:MAG: hypothetical protein JWR85_3820 [Marmoricola sp.]|nr:hypothetical protein [Marmoricola sp.]